MCDTPRAGCAWRTTPTYMWRKQVELEWVRREISIVACSHSVKRCALAARSFQSQQSGALTMMWRWYQVQPSQKKRAIGAVHCKKEGMLLQHLSWCCVDSAIHQNGMCAKGNTQIYAMRTSNNRVISSQMLLAATVWSFAHLPLRLLWLQHKRYTSLSFACPYENDQRWTCTWIWS